jgi:hypothetical protein
MSPIAGGEPFYEGLRDLLTQPEVGGADPAGAPATAGTCDRLPPRMGSQ